ncbi:glycosyl transferase (plasmid) [Lactiplantibacillus plantarum]|uniref:glycosyltransferase WbsX family protein n=1 Tax=Lactiplantibacillus plantarum TaxID=1590 RepID=UPI00062A6BEF|nr:glycoside hydrolase family 99-like domain-containing protein [Lactiplantibacillus plantarum]KKX43459.1 glycosyl transferase [Lactiplantibacillus plantarum]QSE56874.1 glycoside hydrolase family 99-like domain-containing protein [Lactiplantibacillus plantarum]QXN33529.1 glycoside hydrolase family 99-like domain-containing protein [Lactiplantibacillus plantarum subsp. plantarum]
MAKVIAFYLPQYHNIPENDEWWGNGFTEWTNVKKAKPLYEGHEQPRVPKNNKYYNLLDDDVKIWQAKLAKDNGIYGFCYYHYWFDGHMLLEQPMEQMLTNKAVDIPFCISWANEPWTKAWVGETKTLIPQRYGDKKEWKEHFDYLLPFFQDSRYITDDEGKPIFVIYRPEIVTVLNEMLDYWELLAKQNGLPGISFAYQQLNFDLIDGHDDSRFKYDIEFQPAYSFYNMTKNKFSALRHVKRVLADFSEKHFGLDIRQLGRGTKLSGFNFVSYDAAWENILSAHPINKKAVPGAFVDWDNTPRHGERGRVYKGATPQKFEAYFERLLKKSKEEYSSDFIFIDAWNEWAEGAYLEPDERFGTGFLEAIKTAQLNFSKGSNFHEK